MISTLRREHRASLDLDAIRADNPLPGVVGAVVKLHRAGNEFKGCCPFHADRSPSFTIFSGGERFHCFGCGASGDVFDFLGRLYGVGLREAADMDDYAKPMAERVYGDAALPVAERHAAVLARYIRRARLTSINKRELRRSPHKTPLSALREGDALDAAIEHLVDAGWVIAKETREGDNPGRKRSDYAVNPAVLGDFK